MGQKETNAAFVAAVEQSFLTVDAKRALLRAAAKGVSRELWNQFNDQLIASIVASQGDNRLYTERLDDEIDQFTGEYEKEKTVLDLSFRDQLKAAQEAEKEKLWAGYENRIRSLQARLLERVKTTSTTILHDVVMATVPMDSSERPNEE